MSKDVGTTTEILQLIEEKFGPNMHTISLESDLLNKYPKEQEVKSRNHKWDGLKIKIFSAKETICNVKRVPREWKKIFTIYTLDKVIICRIYKGLKKLNTTNNPISKLENELNQQFTDEKLQMIN